MDHEICARGREFAIGEELGHDDGGKSRSLGELDFPLINQPAAALCRFLSRLFGLLRGEVSTGAGHQECQDRQRDHPAPDDPFRCRRRAAAATGHEPHDVTGLHESHPAGKNSGSRKFVEPLLLLS